MYRRFLNNDDYLGIITPEALAQLTRGNDARFIQAGRIDGDEYRGIFVGELRD